MDAFRNLTWMYELSITTDFSNLRRNDRQRRVVGDNFFGVTSEVGSHILSGLLTASGIARGKTRHITDNPFWVFAALFIL